MPVPPKFQKKMEDATVGEGRETGFRVQVSPASAASVEWRKDGKPVRKSKRIDLRDGGDGVHHLIIKNAVRSDEGKYECEASSKGGKVACTARLQVQGTLLLVYLEQCLARVASRVQF